MAPNRPSQPGRPPLPQHFRGEMHPMEHFPPLSSRNTGPPPPPQMMRNIPHPGTRPFGFAMQTPPTFPRGPGHDFQLLPPPMPQFPPHPPLNSFHMSQDALPPPMPQFPPHPPFNSFQSRDAPSYASVVQNPPAEFGCWNCGEPHHRANVCRHGMKLQCHRCKQFGHKINRCPY